MGYYDYFRTLLQPLRLYDLDSGAGAEELRVAGQALDALAAALDETEAESNPLTAADFGLEQLEKLLPYVPAYSGLGERREALAALLRIDGRSFTLNALRDTLSGCGITATVNEGSVPGTVEVSFPNTMGEPEGFEQLRPRIESILPCHLEILYLLRFLLWREVENEGYTWDALEAAAPHWQALERLRLD